MGIFTQGLAEAFCTPYLHRPTGTPAWEEGVCRSQATGKQQGVEQCEEQKARRAERRAPRMGVGGQAHSNYPSGHWFSKHVLNVHSVPGLAAL